MLLPDDSGLLLCVYSAPAGSAAADSLALLAGWSAAEKTTDRPGTRADGKRLG